MKYININDITINLDNKHYEFKHNLSAMINSTDIFFLKNVTSEFIGKTIKINSNIFKVRNNEGGTISVTKKNLIIENCNFDKLYIEADFDNIFIYDMDIKYLFIDYMEIESFRIRGKIENLTIRDSKCKEIAVESWSNAKLFFFNSVSVNTLSFSIQTIEKIELTGINNCDLLSIHNNSQESSTINKLKCVWLNKIKLFKISSFQNIPITIKEMEINRFQDIDLCNINNVTLEKCLFNGNKSYEDIILNFSHLTISQSLKISNCNMKNSTFRNINLSKCSFDNSLILDTKFYECEAENISDIPLKKFKKIIYWSTFFFFVFYLLINTYFSDYINYYFWTGFITPIISGLILLLITSNIFLSAKHFRTLDEIEKLEGEQSFPNFIRGINTNNKKKLEEIESVYRQLKVSFEKDHNKQLANDFLYSESIMKLRQKTLFENIKHVDLYNYLINGFGRRWRRAFLNFLVLFLVSIFTFTIMIDTYNITNKAPDFLKEANQTVFAKNMLDDNNISIPNDGFRFAKNLFTISGTYTISKIDIFRIKTNGWFEEKSFFALLINNFIGLFLVFLFGAFILAFKRRLDK